MGTSKPLTILVHQDFYEQPWVKDLVKKGHTILATILPDCDLILGPNCARFVPGMEQFLDSFLKGARAIRYPGKKGDD